MRLQPLRIEDVARVFGPKLEPARNWTGNRSGRKYPADLVLPAIAWNDRRSLLLVLFGLVPTSPAADKRHTDLHAIGDIGYLECYYGMNGESKNAAIIYFRADNNFVPLSSTNDFFRRLKWEAAKFDSLKKWVDEHIPQTDLGVVEIPARVVQGFVEQPYPEKRLDLGTGTACILRAYILRTSNGNSNVLVDMFKETPDIEERKKSTQSESFFNRPVGPMAFSMDGNLYRFTPKLVEELPAPMR